MYDMPKLAELTRAAFDKLSTAAGGVSSTPERSSRASSNAPA
jgi:hypothetical protein